MPSDHSFDGKKDTMAASPEFTLDLLQRYRGEDIGAGLAAFARAEVEHADPLQARMVSQAQAGDALGVAEAFS